MQSRLREMYNEKARFLLQQEAAFSVHREELEKFELLLIEEENKLAKSLDVGRLAQLVAESVRVQMEEMFVTLVTNALQSVFSDDLIFRLETTIKRGKPSAEFQVVLRTKQGEDLILDPLDSFGGSVSYLVSLILRITLCILYKVEGPIFLDEPTKGCDPDHNARIAAFLSELSDKLGRQLIVVTHDPALSEEASKLIKVSKQGNVSNVEISQVCQ